MHCVLVVVWWRLCGSMWDLSLQGSGFSSCGTRVPKCAGSAVAGPGLSCPESCGILVYWPGIKLESAALEGRFLTSGPPGKSWASFYWRGNAGTEYLISFLVILTVIQALVDILFLIQLTNSSIIENILCFFVCVFFCIEGDFSVTCPLWLPRWPMVKNPPANAGEARNMGLIPGLGRFHGVGNGNPLQYSCLEN